MGRILVADDEPSILEAIIDVLEVAGHNVVGVRDGEEALKRLTNQHFDVALIDVMMPKIDGYHLAAKVHGFSNPPRIIIITARDFQNDKNALRAAGADAFLPKPFSNKDLLEVVQTMLTLKGKS